MGEGEGVGVGVGVGVGMGVSSLRVCPFVVHLMWLLLWLGTAFSGASPCLHVLARVESANCLLASLVLGLLYKSRDVCVISFVAFLALLAGAGTPRLLPLGANMQGSS